MRRLRAHMVVPVVALAALLAGCDADDEFEAEYTETATVAAPNAVTVRLMPVGGATLEGTANLEAAGGRSTRVEVRLETSPDTTLSADVHRGPCRDVEDYNAAYPLGNLDDRLLVTEIPAQFGSLRRHPHSIDVHPLGEPTDMLACANIPAFR